MRAPVWGQTEVWELTFQQDNAKPHTARITAAKIEEWGWHTFKWPANSCDFSPIEFMWAMMAAELDRDWRPANVTQLKRAIEWLWPTVTSPENMRAYWDRALNNMVMSYAVGGDNIYFKKDFKPRRRLW